MEKSTSATLLPVPLTVSTVLPRRTPGLKSSRSHTSLNLFEEGLADFAVYTSSLEGLGHRKFKQDRVIMPQPTADQLCLPYGHDDTIPERPADRYFHLRTRPAWDFDVDQ